MLPCLTKVYKKKIGEGEKITLTIISDLDVKLAILYVKIPDTQQNFKSNKKEVLGPLFLWWSVTYELAQQIRKIAI